MMRPSRPTSAHRAARQPANVSVVPSASELTTVACELITAAAAMAIAQRDFFTLALAGGSTPRPVYTALAGDPDIDWGRWRIFWSDERCVPPQDPQSNYAMAEAALLRRLQRPAGMVVRMRGELEPETAALIYEEALQELVPAHGADPDHLPCFDLILLGMGADGHTASLFPGSSALFAQQRLVVAHRVPQLDTTRLTFTFRLLNAAHRLLFLVSGKDKAPTLAAVLTGAHDPVTLPSQGVSPVRGQISWLVDAAAYSRMSE